MRRMMQSPEGAGTILSTTLKTPSAGTEPLNVEVSGGPLKFR